MHNTELSWSKKIMSIADVTHKVGDRITAIIKEIDTEKRRISLSVKELAPNPWEIVAKTIKKDSIIEGVIQNVTDFGIFISLVQGVDGLVHISDIDWNNRQQALIDLYKKGQKIRVKVISIDAKAERLALGIKQLKINPWIGIDKKLAAGDLVKGTVRYISEFGLFIETAEGIEGLLHINKKDSIIEGVIQNVTDFGENFYIFSTRSRRFDCIFLILINNRQQALIDLYKKGQKFLRVKVISIDAKVSRKISFRY